MKEEALRKLGSEEIKGQALEDIREIVKVWIDYDGEAASLVMEKDKSCSGAFSYMTEQARKKAKNSCYHPSNEEAVEWILTYFGATDPKGLIERGLMFAIMMAEAEKWKPYSEQAKEVNSQPVEAKSAGAGKLMLDLDSLF